MRFHRNQIVVRLLGTLTGIGFLAIGLYAVFGAGDSVAEAARERAMWFGITALVGGVWAIAVSWLDGDLTGVWCAPPARWWNRRFRR